MSADAFFRMGSTHSICQDYAAAGDWYGQSCAIVSDGCSGADENGRVPNAASGAPWTDWGARLLVQAARSRIRAICEGHFLAEALIRSVLHRAECLALPRSALDATLLVATVTPAGDVLVHQTGDGVVAWREVSGAIGYQTVRYALGRPRYLSYLLDPSAHERLVAPSGDSDDLLAGSYEVTSNGWQPRQGWGPQLCRTVSFEASTPYERQLRFHREMPRDGSLRPAVDVVALFSDGVESFRDADLNPVPLETVLLELLSLKNLHGRFVTRRCGKFLGKLCAEKGWRHADDFSMAAVGFEERPGSSEAGKLGSSGSGGERP